MLYVKIQLFLYSAVKISIPISFFILFFSIDRYIGCIVLSMFQSNIFYIMIYPCHHHHYFNTSKIRYILTVSDYDTTTTTITIHGLESRQQIWTIKIRLFFQNSCV